MIETRVSTGSAPHPAHNTVHIMFNVKGGAGKTETTDVLEAVFTLGGHRPVLVDVDDGNSGLTRRIGKDNAVKLNWASGPADAPPWIRRHASSGAPILFDLGAGIMSAELPIMRFLETVWRQLHDRGAKVVFHCVTSTNAPTSRFIDQIVTDYGSFAQVTIVCNDQDGSKTFADLTGRSEPRLLLRHLDGGLQALRLTRKVPLSTVISEPIEGYAKATAMIAERVHRFAQEMVRVSLFERSDLERLEAASTGVPRLMYVIGSAANATDIRIAQNGRVSMTHRALVARDLEPTALLSTAHAYRDAHAAWLEASRLIKK